MMPKAIVVVGKNQEYWAVAKLFHPYGPDNRSVVAYEVVANELMLHDAMEIADLYNNATEDV